VTSFHQKYFHKRWFGFQPRSLKVAIVAYSVFALLLAIVVAGFFLMANGRELIGQCLLGVVALVIVVYNGAALTRSDM
jgi:hypothetical protein